MRAEILSYSRARGLFAGVSLAGSTLRPDNDANKKLYGKDVTAQGDCLRQGSTTPTLGGQVVADPEQKSPKNLSKQDQVGPGRTRHAARRCARLHSCAAAHCP